MYDNLEIKQGQGNKNDSCECAEGFELDQGSHTCRCKKGSKLENFGNFPYNYEKCICDENRVKDSNGNCICKPGAGLTMSAEGECKCAGGSFWDKTYLRCICGQYRIRDVNGTCVCKPRSGLILSSPRGSCVCGDGSGWDQLAKTCICNNYRFKASNGSCICKPRSTPSFNGKCECDVGSIWDSSKKKCVCREDRLEDENGTCLCKPLSRPLKDGKCVCVSGAEQSSLEESCVCTKYHLEHANGTCLCKAGVHPKRYGKFCECDFKYRWDDELERCVLLDEHSCGKGAYWSFFENRCVCFGKNNYMHQNGTCLCQPGSTRINPGFYACQCNWGSHWDDKTKSCICNENRIKDNNGKCICNPKIGLELFPDGYCYCVPGSKWSRTSEKCICSKYHVTLANGTCTCKPGSSQINSHSQSCQCDYGSRWDESQQKCICHEDRFRNDKGACICKPGSHESLTGYCKCDSGYEWSDSDKTCVCNPRRFKHANGSCVCKPGSRLNAKNICQCNFGKYWSNYNNKCVCYDYNLLYQHENGSCICVPNSSVHGYYGYCQCNRNFRHFEGQCIPECLGEFDSNGNCVLKNDIIFPAKEQKKHVLSFKTTYSYISELRCIHKIIDKGAMLYISLHKTGVLKSLNFSNVFYFVKASWNEIKSTNQSSTILLESGDFAQNEHWDENLTDETKINKNISRAVVTGNTIHLTSHQYGVDLLRTFDGYRLCRNYTKIEIPHNESCDQAIGNLKQRKNQTSIHLIATFQNGQVKEEMVYCERFHLHTTCARENIHPQHYQISKDGTLIISNSNQETLQTYTVEEYVPLKKGFQVCHTEEGLLHTNSGESIPRPIKSAKFYITVIGTSLSLLCHLLFILAIITLPSLRNRGAFYILVLVVFLLISDALFTVSFALNEETLFCKWMGVVQYWSLLNVLIWSTIIALDVTWQFTKNLTKPTSQSMTTTLKTLKKRC